MDKRITLKIAKIEDETKNTKTFTYNFRLHAEPGQFIMLSDFEGGEKPFSISNCTEDDFSITVKRIGEFTSRLFQKKVGDYVSIRGAYGSSFFVSKGKVLLIGGGCAVPTFYLLSKILKKNGAEVILINGARTKDEHLFSEKFNALGIKVINTTDDGSFGEKGTSVDIAENNLKKNQFDFVYASGPELMLKALQPFLKNYNYEFLFERYMKCAIGICGNCTMDPLGIRLCVEGPVLPKKLVEQLTEFGQYHRDATVKRIKY